jgi:hypothetical protein
MPGSDAAFEQTIADHVETDTAALAIQQALAQRGPENYRKAVRKDEVRRCSAKESPDFFLT